MSTGGMSRFSDATAATLVKLGLKPQAPSDGVYLAGNTFDRSALGYPQSAELTHNFAWTAASGASGAAIAVETSLFHGDASNMSDETVLKSKTVTVTWVSDAAKMFLVTLPCDLSSAKRYIRGKFKQTKSGTITVNTPLVSQTVRLGGLMQVPNASYAGAGYFEISGGDTAA